MDLIDRQKESSVGYPEIKLTDGSEITMTIKLDRKNKKVFAEIFMMPKYIATEWMFPKKKKRGSARRKRKAEKELEHAKQHGATGGGKRHGSS